MRAIIPALFLTFIACPVQAQTFDQFVNEGILVPSPDEALATRAMIEDHQRDLERRIENLEAVQQQEEFDRETERERRLFGLDKPDNGH
jgi:hypothetical protein